MDIKKLMDIVSDKPQLNESTITECPMASPVQPANEFVSMNISVQAQGIANIRDALQLIHNVESHGQEAVKPMDMPTPGLGIIAKPDDSIDRIKGLAGLDVEIEPEAQNDSEEETEESSAYDFDSDWDYYDRNKKKIDSDDYFDPDSLSDEEPEEDEELESIKHLAGVKTDEGHTTLPAIDKERYTDLSHEGLEGPFRLKSGKVVYYDPKEGKYYDRDSDIYMGHDEVLGHDSELDEISKLAGLSNDKKHFDNEPEEEYQDTQYMTKDLAGGLNKPKKQFKHSYKQGDNPMSMEENIHQDLMSLYKTIRENK